jgi:hypothetical protein
MSAYTPLLNWRVSSCTPLGFRGGGTKPGGGEGGVASWAFGSTLVCSAIAMLAWTIEQVQVSRNAAKTFMNSILREYAHHRGKCRKKVGFSA